MAKKQSRKKATRGAPNTARRRGASAASRSGARRTAKKTTAARKSARGRTPARRTGAVARGRTSRRRTGGLSRSTTHAKWIQSAADRAERPGQTLATRNHEVIQSWAEERGAEPATIPGAEEKRPRALRFSFPGFGGQNLEPVRWNAWFRTFDDRKLVFVFQDRLKNGNQSNFFRLDNPGREDA